MKNKKSFTLMEIMLVVAIVAVLSAIAIPNLLNARKNANQAAAQATLRTISTSIETYASTTGGEYAPSDGLTDDAYLTGATPPYLSKTYCGTTVSGYNYSCVINKGNYTITAAANNCGVSGDKDYSVSTGALLGSSDCS